MRNVLIGHVVLLVVGLTSMDARANSISEVYDEAFANPLEFDGYVYGQLLFGAKDSFYGKFAKCAQMAVPVFAQMENNLKAQYKVCPNNSQCQAIAKEIGVAAEVKENIRGLASYFAGEPEKPFAKSEIGRIAISRFEYMKKVTGLNDAQATAMIRQTPAYVGVIAALASLPCQ